MRLLFMFILLLPCCVKRQDSNALLAWLETEASHDFLFTHPEPQHRWTLASLPRDRIVYEIRQAHTRIDFWCYEFDEPQILAALTEARERGVQIHITGSPDQTYDEFASADFHPYIRSRSGLQHAKLMLIDHVLLISGTGNFTISDLFHNNNAFLFLRIAPTQGEEILQALRREQTDAPVVRGLPYGGRMLVSPAKGRLIQSRLLQGVLNAKRSVRYMIFSHSDPTLTAALALKANEGIPVEGIYDSDKTELEMDSEGSKLNESLGLLPSAVYVDGNRSLFQTTDGVLHGGHLHHKTMIIDDRVLTGSYNFSMNARDTNMEVFFEFEDPRAVSLFEAEFQRMRDIASVLGRSPVTGLAGDVYAVSDGYCGNENLSEFVSFYGHSYTFGADHFKASGGTCVQLKNRGKASAGLSSGKEYPLPLGQSTYAHGLRRFSRNEVEKLPKTSGILPLHRMSKNWIWTKSALPLSHLVLWTRQGLIERHLTSISPHFHAFDDVESLNNSIVFAGGNGIYFVGCVSAGELNGPPADLRDAFAFETGESLECAAFE
ncbi:MAG: hypothetical protein JNM27_21600 [Leptospirales bacterium]|nr:hypothetical protein [Leptospirales bacterium]